MGGREREGAEWARWTPGRVIGSLAICVGAFLAGALFGILQVLGDRPPDEGGPGPRIVLVWTIVLSIWATPAVLIALLRRDARWLLALVPLAGYGLNRADHYLDTDITGLAVLVFGLVVIAYLLRQSVRRARGQQ